MKNVIYRFAWIIIFVLLHSGLNAQTNYRSGYLITLKEDTVFGEIDFRTDRMNSKRCVFREKDGAKEETYYPFDIFGYRFIDDGKYYVSKSIELKYGEPQPVFLEYLLQGLRSLYYYENEGKIPVYFVEKDSLLVKVDAPRLANGASGYQFKNVGDRYIPVLHYVFNDCSSLNARIDKIRFNRDDLVRLAKDYHYAMCASNEDCIEFEAKEDRRSVQLRFSPYAGIVQYILPSNELFKNYGRPELSYLAGITISVSSKRWMNSFSGCLDVSFSHISVSESEYSYFYKEHYFTKHTGTMLSGKLGVRYTYQKKNIRPFAEFGIDISSLLAPKQGESSIEQNWMDGIYLGYYANVGVNLVVSKKHERMIFIRAQFRDIYERMEKYRLMVGLSGAIGFTF